MESPLLTYMEACEYLRISPTTMKRALSRGQLSSIQYTAKGNHYFTKEMLDTFALENIR